MRVASPSRMKGELGVNHRNPTNSPAQKNVHVRLVHAEVRSESGEKHVIIIPSQTALSRLPPTPLPSPSNDQPRMFCAAEPITDGFKSLRNLIHQPKMALRGPSLDFLPTSPGIGHFSIIFRPRPSAVVEENSRELDRDPCPR